MYTIVSTRFNNDTWCENYHSRLKRNISCFYGAPHEMSPKIDYGSTVFVVEMNNSKNQIEGIGLIRNKPCTDKYYSMYNDHNLNRYVYIGKHHMSREMLMRSNQKLVEILDYILFKEKTHMKRGAGFTTIPDKLMTHIRCENRNIKKELRDIFINYYDKSEIIPI
jgi:hypothetical protein